MPFLTDGSREDASSAFFLISKVLCFCFRLNSGLTFAAVIRHYSKRQLKGGKGFISDYASKFQCVAEGSRGRK